MADHTAALEDLRRLLSDERLRRRTLDALASGELAALTEPREVDMIMADTEQISLRLPKLLLERCDRLVESLGQNPDLAAMGRLSRAAVVRLALQRGLDQLEQGQAGDSGKRRR